MLRLSVVHTKGTSNETYPQSKCEGKNVSILVISAVTHPAWVLKKLWLSLGVAALSEGESSQVLPFIYPVNSQVRWTPLQCQKKPHLLPSLLWSGLAVEDKKGISSACPRHQFHRGTSLLEMLPQSSTTSLCNAVLSLRFPIPSVRIYTPNYSEPITIFC